MRCPDCNKFVSQDAGNPEVNNVSINDGDITVEVDVVVNCAECGTELKRGNLELEDSIGKELLEKHTGEGHELDAEEDSSEPIDDWKTTDRSGKQIKNSRYHTHLYGARVNVSVKCSCQEEEITNLELSDSMPASALDESV